MPQIAGVSEAFLSRFLLPDESKIGTDQEENEMDDGMLAWTEDNLLRQVVYEGLREDKPAREVRREVARSRPAGTN